MNPPTTLLVALVMATPAAFAAIPIGMSWTPGGYTATTADSPPTAANGTIVSSFTPTTMNSVMTTNPSNGVTGALYIDGTPTSGPVASQDFSLSFDISVNAQPASATVQPKLLDLSLMGGSSSSGTAGILLGMNIAATVPGPASPWAFRFVVAPTSGTGGVFGFRSQDNSTIMAFSTYSVGTSYNLFLDADYDTGTVDAYVNGVQLVTDFAFATGGGGVTTSEVFIHLNGQSGTANEVSLTNFTAAVPEPSGAAILGALAGLSLLRRKK